MRTYVHLLDQCSQNWFSVASLYENTLTEVKRKSPEIVEAFARSDNAGCYHCALLLLSIHGISQRTGIVTSRYDFSESNSGKDICDRHISPMKSHIRQYVNAGHDVENASDMKRALDSYSGVRGCRASVVKVNTSAQQIHSHNWTGVQMFSNFQFSEGGIRMWKAYNIGQGKFVHYQKLTKKGGSQGDTGLVVIEPFTSPRMSVGCLQTVKSNKAKNSNDDDTNETCEFSCPQAGCIKLFKTSTAMQKHIDVGRHCFRPQKDSAYDTIKRKWAYACTSIRPSYVSSEESPRDLSVTDYPSVELGWGLKKSRRATRFSQQVKGYLMKLFLDGEQTGNKCDPAVVALNLKSVRAADGSKLFSSSDWLSAQQVASYFSRLAVIARSGRLRWNNKESVQEEDTVDALVERGQWESVRDQVLKNVDL